MNRHRDHLTFSDLTNEHLKRIRNFDWIRRLREQRLALKNELRALCDTPKKARHVDPGRYREHEAFIKELARVRVVYRRRRRSNLERITSMK